MNHRMTLAATAIAAMVATGVATATTQPGRTVTVEVYDSFDEPGYDLAQYQAKWANPYGPGEMGVHDTRAFDGDTFSIDAVPFRTGFDFSVFDHIKYIGVSTEVFEVPEHGSITFSAEIDAQTPGTEPDGRLVRGVYGPPGCADDPACAATAEPWEAVALEGQQAGATLHMIDFATGQLFDWFVSGSTAFALTERLPATVIGSPDGGQRDTMYTQIVEEVPIEPGPHTVAITFFRSPSASYADFLLDGRRVARVHKVGVPLDEQNVPYTGIYPALGPGEELANDIETVAMAHGLFSLLDAFPFQHPDVPESSVSISLDERLFGQGARATFDDFVVTTDDRG